MAKETFITNPVVYDWLNKIAAQKEVITSTAVQHDHDLSFVSEGVEALRAIGYGKITLPKADGGEGLSLYDALTLQETVGSYDGSTALAIGWTLLTVGELYENRYWTQENLNFFAKEVANGAIVNRAVSEVATGSPIRGGRPTTTAKKVDGKWLLNGRKSYTTCSTALDYFLTSAWIEEDEHIGFFLIAKDTAGLRIEENWDVMAMRGTGSHDIVLEDVILEENLLVEIPSYSTGFKLNGWLLLIPATYLGIAQAARDYAVDFATKHKPNSLQTTIAHLPNVQSLIGEMDLLLAQARFALYGTAKLYENVEQKNNLVNEINIAKHTVTNAALAIVDKAMRLVGAKSLQLSNPLQRYYRDIRAGLHNPPMDDLTITKLAQSALAHHLKEEI